MRRELMIYYINNEKIIFYNNGLATHNDGGCSR